MMTYYIFEKPDFMIREVSKLPTATGGVKVEIPLGPDVHVFGIPEILADVLESEAHLDKNLESLMELFTFEKRDVKFIAEAVINNPTIFMNVHPSALRGLCMNILRADPVMSVMVAREWRMAGRFAHNEIGEEFEDGWKVPLKDFLPLMPKDNSIEKFNALHRPIVDFSEMADVMWGYKRVFGCNETLSPFTNVPKIARPIEWNGMCYFLETRAGILMCVNHYAWYFAPFNMVSRDGYESVLAKVKQWLDDIPVDLPETEQYERLIQVASWVILVSIACGMVIGCFSGKTISTVAHAAHEYLVSGSHRYPFEDVEDINYFKSFLWPELIADNKSFEAGVACIEREKKRQRVDTQGSSTDNITPTNK